MDGDADTVQAAAYSPGPGAPFTVTNLSVFRQVVDMAEPGSGTWVIPGGASGNPESPHFADQLPVWGEHRRIPIRN
jgi:penicillin amidase